MKSNTKGKLILICLVAMLSLSFVFGSNIANYPVKLSEDPVNASEQNVEKPRASTNGAFGKLWKANGKEITDSQEINANIYRIISDGKGGAIITFQETNGGKADIYAQKINSNGDRLWGVNGTLICNAPDNQYILAICLDGDGGAIITWEDWRLGNPNRDIYAQRVSSDGITHWGDGSMWGVNQDRNGTVICNATGAQYKPEICAIDGGGAIITWYDARQSIFSDIYAQKVSSDGTTHWGESWWSPNDRNGTVICNATDYQGQVQICSDGANGAIITWDDNRGIDCDIYAQRVSSDGTTYWGEPWWSGPGDLNGTVISNATNSQDWPKICSVEGGGAIITWEDFRSGEYHISAQKVSSDGATYWGESWWSGPGDLNGTIICNATGGQAGPMLCDNEAGGAFITWEDYRIPGEIDIYAQNVSSDGTTYWGESWWSGPGDLNGTVICNATDDQEDPSICVFGSEDVIIVWTDKRPASGIDIYAQRVSSNGISNWGDGTLWGGKPDLNGTAICSVEGENAALNDDDPTVPSMCSDNSNGVIIAWWDWRGTGISMYAQRVGIKSPGNFILDTNTTLPDTDGIFWLNWSVSIGADNYSVYWSTTPGVDDGDTLYIEGLVNDTMLIKGFTSGTYYFRMVSYNNTGSTWSNELNINIKIPSKGILPFPSSDDDDDDDDDTGFVVVLVIIIIIACVGGVFVVIIVLIKKGIIDTTKLKRG